MGNRCQVAFIMSLPRSGSTLLQRFLSSHPVVKTVPESWMLLHSLYPMTNDQEYSEYSSYWARRGLLDFLRQIPLGVEEYSRRIGDLFLEMLKLRFNDEPAIFIEKTPRYSLIVDQLITAFPEAKFIFLWRNPLAIKQSMNETWSRGRWHFRCDVDLYVGLPKLIAARKSLGGRAIDIRYEDMIEDPVAALSRIQSFLGIPIYQLDLAKAAESLESAVMGDKRGMKIYGSAVAASPKAVGNGYANWIRRAFARKYLKHLGDDALEAMGYNRQKILAEVNATPLSFRFFLSDAFRILYSRSASIVPVEMIVARFRKGVNRHLLS